MLKKDTPNRSKMSLLEKLFELIYLYISTKYNLKYPLGIEFRPYQLKATFYQLRFALPIHP